MDLRWGGIASIEIFYSMNKLILQIVITLFLFLSLESLSQPTLGLIQHTAGSLDEGYILFAPMRDDTTYLIDKCGRKVHSWHSQYKPGLSVYLLPDGSLLRPGYIYDTTFSGDGDGGIIEKLDWNSNVVWSFKILDSLQCQHHDVKMLPNGNILALVRDVKTKAQAIAAGRDTTLIASKLWSEKIVELQPIGTDSAIVVWEWKVWDHLVQAYDNTKPNFFPIASKPELIDINGRATNMSDWLHCNALDYNPAFDQVMITNHNFGEIWIIDHSTTTAEAASHSGGNSGKGGDLLYRWGNSLTYGSGTLSDRKFWGPHNGRWIEPGLPNAGSILVFNNRHPFATNDYSSVEIFHPPVDSLGNYNSTLPYLPTSSSWVYADTSLPGNFSALVVSGAQQLSNGNLLICDGPKGKFFEVDSLENKVWEYVNPVGNSGPLTQGTIMTINQNMVFRCTFYPATYSGFLNQILTAGLPIELNPLPDSCGLSLTTSINNIDEENGISVYPNPVTDWLNLLPAESVQNVKVINLLGQSIIDTKSVHLDLTNLSKGVYIVKVETNGNKMIIKRIVKN